MAKFVRPVGSGLLVVAVLLGVRPAGAASSPEQKCQAARYKAAVKYFSCYYTFKAGGIGGGILDQPKVSRCHVRYADAWTRLQLTSGTGTTCDYPRFVDNGDGTVTDNLTTLQWEKKTDDASVHDKDDTYAWTTTFEGVAADGTAYTTFLAALNGGGCFAGQCDWRLPTTLELQTIVHEANPCGTSPCIDPIFGPTIASYYWTSSTMVDYPIVADLVRFSDGLLVVAPKTFGAAVRAVRGGL